MDPSRDDPAVSRPAAEQNPKRLPGWFIAIIAFKFLKAAAFLLVGVLILRFAHVTRHGALMGFARFLNANPDREIIRRLSTFFEATTIGQREAIGVAAIAIGVILAGEGFLLLARIWWATYFTIFMTLCGIPIELFEIARKPYQFRRWVYLVINIAIVVFLWRRRNEFRDQFNSSGITAQPPEAAR